MKLVALALAGWLSFGVAVAPALAKLPPPSSVADFTEFEDPFEEVTAEIPDPLEVVNRTAFALNDHLYTRILQPLCSAASPSLRGFLARAAERWEQSLTLGGAELQFQFRDAGSEIGKFILHGLLGWLDKIDPEKTAGLAAGHEDFDHTLGTLGIGSGFYLVLPVLGPSSLRGGVGRVASFYLDPSPNLFDPSHCLLVENEEKSLLDGLKVYEAIRRDSLDPYLFIRNAYAQQREAAGKSVHSARPPVSPFKRIASY
ncbi:MAG: VacJ family lipoprotein [Desulfuromonadales bacterium]|nr:VacJ family lipoprotein [Desulfuromonadales bacterium]